jgi:hypothetical protein
MESIKREPPSKRILMGVTSLRKRVAELEAENSALREQNDVLSGKLSYSQLSHEKSVQEQRANFFKYRNAGRY